MAVSENEFPDVLSLRKFFSKIYIYSGSRRRKQIEKKSIQNVRTGGILGGTIQMNALYKIYNFLVFRIQKSLRDVCRKVKHYSV